MEQSGAEIIPIDSEHNAIFQCLPDNVDTPLAGVRKILLTASGGPFLHTPRDRLSDVTPEQARQLLQKMDALSDDQVSQLLATLEQE